jgi:hypothetical protein
MRGSPIAIDVFNAVQNDGDLAVARPGRATIDGEECVAQPARRRGPARRHRRSLRGGHQNAAQGGKVLGRAADRAEARDEKGHGDRSGGDVGASIISCRAAPLARNTTCW